jgi:hypothetical protein
MVFALEDVGACDSILQCFPKKVSAAAVTGLPFGHE